MLRFISLALGVACVCVVSALPTQTDNTLVVSRDEGGSGGSTASEVSTTEGPLAPIKIYDMNVHSAVTLRYSHTAVVTRVRNSATKAQEATFRVLLPQTAFISGFVMTLDGKEYKAYVKEKDEAKQIYNQAVSQGLGAAHVAAKARDSNQFTVSVNVEPNTEAVFNLTYEELLERRNGVYNHAINLHPGALVPKLTVTVDINEDSKLSTVRVPKIRTGNEIDASEEDPPNPKATIVKHEDGKGATITFSPDLEEQKELMEVYAEKSRASDAQSKRKWYEDDDEDNTLPTEGTLGQFVVQYDVERSNDGEILVNDGYFVHFFAPSNLPPLNKHVVFVLDTSGSMMDRKIAQLREAMRSILGELRTGDYFNIVEFSSEVTVHDLKEAEKNETRKNYSYYYNSKVPKQPTTLVSPSQATKENIEKAKIIVSRLSADGGTNIDSALGTAIDIVTKGIDLTAATGEKKTAVAEDKPNEEAPKLEPIIIFLTDGEPTVGITDTDKIIRTLSEKNYGEHKAAIFSLAFGEDADRKFLRKLSLRAEGFMRHIYEAADAALQLRDFYKQVSSPLLSHVRFVYPPDQVKESSLTKNNFHTYYLGSEVVVAGKVEEGKELTPEVLAFCGVDDTYARKKFRVVPIIPSGKKAAGYLPLERLWAYLTIKQLLDKKDAEISGGDSKDQDKKEESPEKRALALALKYEFVTPLTSLVVVKPNATKAVDAESVDKPTASAGFPAAAAQYARPEALGMSTSSGSFAYGTSRPSGRVRSRIGTARYAEVFRPMAMSNVQIHDRAEIFEHSALAFDVVAEEIADIRIETADFSTASAFSALPSFFMPPPAAPLSGTGYSSYSGLAGHRLAFSPYSSSGLFSKGGHSSYPTFAAHHVSYPAISMIPVAHDYPTPTFVRPIEDSGDRIISSDAFEDSDGDRILAGLYARFPVGDTDVDEVMIGLPGSAGGAFGEASRLPPLSEPLSTPDYSLSPDIPSGFPGSPGLPGYYESPDRVSSTTPAPLSKYRLKDFHWIDELIKFDKDALEFTVNGTLTNLKLSTDEASDPSGEGAPCQHDVVSGVPGVCAYLARCPEARYITATQYQTLYCDMNGYAGVCCPKEEPEPKTR